MGEAKWQQLALQRQALQCIAVETPVGRILVHWDHDASATPKARLTFFAELLANAGATTPGSTVIHTLIGCENFGRNCDFRGLPKGFEPGRFVPKKHFEHENISV